MERKYIMALDQGTTSSRAVIFNHQGKIISIAAKEFRQIFPQPGWVEHDPMEIWDTQMGAARQALDAANLSPQQIAAIGVTNQRETTLIWDRESGRPVYNAIVWQCRRTAPACSKIKKTKFAQKNSQENWIGDRRLFFSHQGPVDFGPTENDPPGGGKRGIGLWYGG